MNFRDMNISEPTVKALDSLRYLEPTEVQQKVIPFILAGKNVMVRSKTGTGKTAAFGISLIERIRSGNSKKALILAPTRELAVQICKEIRLLASYQRLRVTVVYGGQSINPQIDTLRHGVEVLIATPGRLLDLFRRNAVKLHEFDFVVLDEADRMLDMGFIDDITAIMDQVSKQRMTHLFSATLDERVHTIARRYISDPEILHLGAEEKPPEIHEETTLLGRPQKFGRLKEILAKHSSEKILIFVATQRAVDFIWRRLADVSIPAVCIHGGLTQAKRERTLQDFKDGRCNIMVATDVASRGLHIDDIGLVINYDQAMDADTHIHRIGRTGRMGKAGKAITFVETGHRERLRSPDEYVDLSEYYKRGEKPPEHLLRQHGRSSDRDYRRGPSSGGRSGDYGHSGGRSHSGGPGSHTGGSSHAGPREGGYAGPYKKSGGYKRGGSGEGSHGRSSYGGPKRTHKRF
ncbi:MAG: DEAD/DEAH box helicase [Candidatus Micrarchaeota archaeon]